MRKTEFSAGTNYESAFTKFSIATDLLSQDLSVNDCQVYTQCTFADPAEYACVASTAHGLGASY